MASPTSSALRLTLRAGLLTGALLDAALTVAVLAVARGFDPGLGLSPETVSYPWLLAPCLAGRAGIQGFSCYDRHRYEQAIPWLAITLVATGLAGWPQGSVGTGLVAAYGLVGTLQLISWRRTRV